MKEIEPTVMANNFCYYSNNIKPPRGLEVINFRSYKLEEWEGGGGG